MKKYIWILVALLTLTACSSDDNNEKEVENLTAEMLAGLWVSDYAEEGTEGGVSWTRVIESYQFKSDGTGYYECYLLDDQNLAAAEWTRDNCSFRFTISGNTVTIFDQTGDTWPMTYDVSDGKQPQLTDDEGFSVTKATTEQQTLVNQLYADWQGMNSGEEEEEEVQDLNDVDGNVDLNNGGGGVNEVR